MFQFHTLNLFGAWSCAVDNFHHALAPKVDHSRGDRLLFESDTRIGITLRAGAAQGFKAFAFDVSCALASGPLLCSF